MSGYCKKHNYPKNVFGGCLECDKEKEEITRLTARNAELEEKHRWIPVSERLPEVGIEVLTTRNNGICTAEIHDNCLGFKDGKCWMTEGNYTGGYSPTHWKLIILPKPTAEARKAGET